MPDNNAPFSAFSRVDRLKQQLEKLEHISHTPPDPQSLEDFDVETEQVIQSLDKSLDSRRKTMAGYKFATMAEGEALLNLPESAQEPTSRDLLQKSIQQRRQLLLGLISEMEKMEEQEAEVLTGEDKEDPPSLT